MNEETISRHLRYIPKVVWVAVTVAISINTLGLLFIFTHYNQEALVAGDGLIYYELAQNIHDGHGFTLFREGAFLQETFRTPGLPLLLVLFFKIGLGFKTYVTFISLLSAVLIPMLSWYIGKNLFTPAVGILTALLLSLEPLIWLYNWSFLTEIPFLIVTLLGSTLLIRAYKNHTVLSYDSFFAGIFFAYSAYIRPAAFPLLVLCLLAVYIERSITFKKLQQVFLFVFIIVFVCLLPWYAHMHQITGVYALSGTGWRNVYTDYLASIRSIEKGTRFIDEKKALKQYAMQTWKLTDMGINNPKNSTHYKEYALPEIWSNKSIVIKLQSVLFISYFTHTDYQRKLQKLGILPMNITETGRVSSSRLLIDKGLGAVPDIYKEMKNRYFLPVIERMWSLSLFLFALVGFFVSKSKARFLVFLLLLFGYLTSSAIGLGVESRLRLPILPFYFMLASCGILFVLNYGKQFVRPWKK